MPQSLADVLLHIVFSTKHRAPYQRTAERREALNGYMAGTLRNLNCPVVVIGGVEDHVHVLCHLSRTLSIAKLVEELKSSSSKWVKQQDQELHEFH